MAGVIPLSSAVTADASDCPILVVDRLFSPEECADIVQRLGRDGVLHRSLTTSGEDPLRVSEQTRVDEQWIAQRCAEALKSYALERDVEVYADQAGNINMEFMSLILYRGSEGGNYGWHTDNGMTLRENRKVALVVALNDPGEFEGGGTEWMWPGPDRTVGINGPAGTASMFPSLMMHRGVPVTAGERWILVTWALGPPWR